MSRSLNRRPSPASLQRVVSSEAVSHVNEKLPFPSGSFVVVFAFSVRPSFVLPLMLKLAAPLFWVSMARLSPVLASSPSALVLPAASEKLELATLIRPLLVLLAVGVNLAE